MWTTYFPSELQVYVLTQANKFALWPVSTPVICQSSWGIAALAPAEDSHADLCLWGHLGISCMPPTTPHSPRSNRPPANYGFPRSLSSKKSPRNKPRVWDVFFCLLRCGLFNWGFSNNQWKKLKTKKDSKCWGYGKFVCFRNLKQFCVSHPHEFNSCSWNKQVN